MNAPTAYTEQELVSALKARDNRAFSHLYDHYSGALFTVIRQIVDDPNLAPDVLQEVFLSIWRRIESYDPARGRLFTWMLNIARHAAIDMLRSKAYQNSRKNQEIGDNVNTRSIFGQNSLPNVDSIGLRKSLESLKPELRELIELAYFKGYTQEEIADIEDIPLGTVKTRMRTALKQLRELFK